LGGFFSVASKERRRKKGEDEVGEQEDEEILKTHLFNSK